MQMRRRTMPRLAPLLEQAELGAAVCGRDAHAGEHALAPLLARRGVQIDDAHASPIANCDTLANDADGHNWEGNRCPFNRRPRRTAYRSQISIFRSGAWS